MWPGSVEINKQSLDGPKWGGNNSSTLSDSNPWQAKDSMTSGWGSVNQSPVPNAGTEGWSTAIHHHLQQNNAGSSMLPQQLENRSHSSFTSIPQQPANTALTWGTGSGNVPAGAWSRGNPMASNANQTSTTSASNQSLVSGGPSSWAEAVANKQPNNVVGLPGGCQGSGTLVSITSSQPSQASIEEAKAKKTQDELIAMAINSNEGWGKTVIRQDTAWIIDDPPPPNEASHKDSHLEPDQHGTAALTSKQIITGTAIWESLKTPQKPAELSTPWEAGKASAAIVNGPTSDVLNANQQSTFRQTSLDNKSTLSSTVNWPIQASTNSTLTTSTMNWGSVAIAGGATSDISWGENSTSGNLKKEEERPLWGLSNIGDVGSKSSADLGISCWERNSLPLHRSSSTGSWIEETSSDMNSGTVSGGWNEEKNNPSVLHEIDDGTSLWGDPGQKSQPLGWRPSSVLSSKGPSTMRKSESEVFNSSNAGNPLGLKLGFGAEDLTRTWNTSLPPPCTESSGWGSTDMKESSWVGLLNQNSQRLKPPFRPNSDINDWSALSNNRLLFDKGQPPQRSALLQKLINMGFKREEAQDALISNNMNYDEAMTMLLKTKVPGNSLDHSLSSSSATAQGRFNLNSTRTMSGGMEDMLGIDNGTLDLIGLTNLSINSNSSGINGISSNLVNQLRGSASNANLHQFASSLGNPNLDFSVLFTSGPVIPQLQTANKPLAPLASQQHSRPMPSLPQQQQSPFMQQFIQCVQSAVQLGLLPPQAINQHSLSNPNFPSSLQLLLKLHDNQKLLLQSMQQGPPPGHSSGSALCQQQQHQIYECTAIQQHMESIKRQLVQMAASNAVSTTSSIAPSSRLISQWKVSDGTKGNDINRLQHSSSLLEQNDSISAPSAWLPMTSASTSSWLSGDASANNLTTSNDPKLAPPSLSVTTNPAQTSSLSEPNSASAAIASLDIEEFVPGKPWQGPGTKNVEDDPYLTPGSIVRNSISSVKDSQVASILGKTIHPSLSSTSGTVNNAASNNPMELKTQGPPFSSSKLGSQWVVPDSRSSDLWPGQSFANKSGVGQWNPVNRSISWASGDRADNISSTTAMSNWSMSSPPSNWLLIKSLPQMDSMNMQSLCHQYGAITSFTSNFYQGQSLVFYSRAEDAMKAYRGMNSCRLGNSLIKAEFISDADVGQVVNRIHQQQQQQQQLATPASGFQQASNGMMGAIGGSGLMGNGGILGNGPAFFGKLPLSVPPGGDPSLLAGLRAPPHWGSGLSSGGMMGHLWNNPTSPNGQQSLWGSGIGLEDHDHGVFLPGDLLGNQ